MYKRQVRELKAIEESQEYRDYRQYLDTKDNENASYTQEDIDRFEVYACLLYTSL